jgi:hypothetical protein
MPLLLPNPRPLYYEERGVTPSLAGKGARGLGVLSIQPPILEQPPRKLTSGTELCYILGSRRYLGGF